MARSQITDPLLAHHFGMFEIPQGPPIPYIFSLKQIQSALHQSPYLGFADISLPQPQLETRDVKEGNNPWVHTVPLGYMTAGEVVLTHAVMPTNFEMYIWFRLALLGRTGLRRHLAVVNLKQDKMIPYRITVLESCFPTSWKPMTDLSANSAEVLLEELTLNVHNVWFLPVPVPVGQPNRTSVPRQR